MALAERNVFEIYNVSDPSMPEIIGVGEASAPFCPGFAFSHYSTKGQHLYVTGFIRNPVSDSCPGLPGGDTYPGFIFDLSDPTAPTFGGYFSIPEVKEYTGASGFFFGEGEYSHIAAVS